MGDKEDKEMVELLWGITEKLDKLLTAVTKLGEVVASKDQSEFLKP